MVNSHQGIEGASCKIKMHPAGWFALAFQRKLSCALLWPIRACLGAAPAACPCGSVSALAPVKNNSTGVKPLSAVSLRLGAAQSGCRSFSTLPAARLTALLLSARRAGQLRANPPPSTICKHRAYGKLIVCPYVDRAADYSAH